MNLVKQIYQTFLQELLDKYNGKVYIIKKDATVEELPEGSTIIIHNPYNFHKKNRRE